MTSDERREVAERLRATKDERAQREAGAYEA